jgi:H+/Cl- antiporter ClcA
MSASSPTDPPPQREHVLPDILAGAAPALLSVRRWKARAVLWLAAAAVGVAAVLFARLADLAQNALRTLTLHSALWPLLLAPLGFCLIAWLTQRYFHGAEGSGIPQTIYTLQPRGEAAIPILMRPRVAIARVLLTCAGLLCGGSIGREGPTVQVGAAIVYGFGRWIPHRELAAQRHVLILAGGAAGVAAAFNTPLAGIVFAIEELARSFEERASGVTLTAVVLAGIIAIAIAGDYTYFGTPVVTPAAYRLSLGTFAVALASGLAGGLYSRLTIAGVRGLPRLLGRLQRRRVWFALVCGAAVALIGALSGGLTYGSGYVEAKSILESNAHLPWSYAPARALATLASFLSGLPCGLFAPSLSTGAGLGQVLAGLFGQSSAVPFAILGMCGYLAAVTQAPLTALVIVMELTTQHHMIIPLMVTVIIATTVSRLLSPPLYRALAERYV